MLVFAIPTFIPCSEGVTVQFVRGDQEVAVRTPSRTDETIYNMNLVLDEDSAAAYTYMVRTEIPNDLVMQSFNITGGCYYCSVYLCINKCCTDIQYSVLGL